MVCKGEAAKEFHFITGSKKSATVLYLRNFWRAQTHDVVLLIGLLDQKTLVDGSGWKNNILCHLIWRTCC